MERIEIRKRLQKLSEEELLQLCTTFVNYCQPFKPGVNEDLDKGFIAGRLSLLSYNKELLDKVGIYNNLVGDLFDDSNF